MRVRIHLSVLDDSYKTVELIHPVEALFDWRITPETVNTAQKLVAEALERHTRKNKTFDGLSHYDAGNKS